MQVKGHPSHPKRLPDWIRRTAFKAKLTMVSRVSATKVWGGRCVNLSKGPSKSKHSRLLAILATFFNITLFSPSFVVEVVGLLSVWLYFILLHSCMYVPCMPRKALSEMRVADFKGRLVRWCPRRHARWVCILEKRKVISLDRKCTYLLSLLFNDSLASSWKIEINLRNQNKISNQMES